jgi:hypothetical protein
MGRRRKIKQSRKMGEKKRMEENKKRKTAFLLNAVISLVILLR